MQLSKFFENKIILVIGGTGTIGSEIVNQLIKFNPKTIRILSNSENELWEMKLKFKDKIENLRFLLGDIREFERVKRAVKGVDYVFNAAAVKHVPFSEYNPIEAVNINILGLENIIEAIFEYNVEKLIHISTDKAVNPTTVMGATKMIGERLCISREVAKGTQKSIISCVRFGNVLGSRGSIIPLIKRQIREGNEVTLTNEKMRRFVMSISEAVRLVLKAMVMAHGGEIFVLKMPLVLIKDLLEVIIEEYALKIKKDPKNIKIEIIGSRAREKINESLISPEGISFFYDTGDMFIIHPEIGFKHRQRQYDYLNKYKKVNIDESSSYSTATQEPLSKLEIKELLNKLNLI